MASQELEPCLRMAISNIRMALLYIDRVPGDPRQIQCAREDMQLAIGRIQKYADKKGIQLRETMKT